MSLDKEYDTLSEMMMTLMNDVGSIPDGSSFGSPPRAWPAADSAPRWLCWAPAGRPGDCGPSLRFGVHG